MRGKQRPKTPLKSPLVQGGTMVSFQPATLDAMRLLSIPRCHMFQGDDCKPDLMNESGSACQGELRD